MGRIRGFTLIELMVTLAVFAIVAGLAIPSFTQMIRDNRSVALADNLLSAANYARAQAVTVKGAVSLCASADGATCGADWTAGWIVFADGAATETATPPQVSEVLRHWEAPGSNASIEVQQNSTDTNFIRFTGLGTLARTGNAAIAAKIEGCTGNSARNITINRGGVARATAAEC